MVDYHSLRISKQPPSHAFPNDWFEIEVTVEKQQDAPRTLDHLTLWANVHVHDGRLPMREPCSPGVAKLTVDPSTPLQISLQHSLSKTKSVVKCKIDATVSSDTKMSVCIGFSLESENVHVNHAYTEPIHLINYKLSIEPKDWEDVWYKDEGGRDKCMQAEVQLQRGDGAPVYGLRVPLRLILRYADTQSTTVRKQDILKILGHPTQFIDPETGKALVRFRVEDVSKNHQGQDFKLEISADATRFADVAPASTPSVSVRSKRNKRQRFSMDASLASQAGEDASQSKPAHTPQGTTHGTIPYGVDPQGLGTQMPFQYRPNFSPHTGPDVTEMARLRDAMQGIVRWADEVVNGLYPLQWKVIGYAPFPDGTVDYNHPYYSMPNPNACISKLLSMYSSNARDDLRVLMNAVENTLTRRDQEHRTSATYDFSASDDPRVHHAHGAPYDQSTVLPFAAQVRTDPYSPPRIVGPVRQDVEESPEELEAQVTYVLAKQYKALRTGHRLGFPAFNAEKKILGFFQESTAQVGVERFVPISRLKEDFGQLEKDQAAQILNDAIESRSEAVYSIKDFGSVQSLIESALVFEWSKGAGHFPLPLSGGSGSPARFS